MPLPIDHHYDPDRHCGVWLVDEKRNCLRSLTCKVCRILHMHYESATATIFSFKYHSLSLRRQVKDRSKPFDELLMLHREQKRGKASMQTLNSQPTIIAQATSTRCPTCITQSITHSIFPVAHLTMYKYLHYWTVCLLIS